MTTKRLILLAAAGLSMVATAALGGWPGDPAKCRGDAVKAGPICIDTYEASVWEVPDPATTNKALVKKIQNGKATAAQLSAAGAVQRGLGSDDYPPSCPDDGQGCADLFAVSIAGVLPSANITWFQAQQACFNSRKRLPSNAEWQGAVAGTPNPGPDNGSTDCNSLGPLYAATGARTACVSRFGAYDMVGNAREWVADWVPRSTTCGSWGASTDAQCLAGAATTGAPAALVRGGDFFAVAGTSAGPLAVNGDIPPNASVVVVGFRCAR